MNENENNPVLIPAGSQVPFFKREFYVGPYFTALKITFPPFLEAADIVPFLDPPK